MTIRQTISLLFVALCVPGSSLAAGDKVDFSRDILPLLSDNCFKCHGPDEANRKAKLRFDKHEASIEKLDNGRATIVAGKSAQSELYSKITAEDPEDRMPPPDTGKTLSKSEIELVRKWIDSGAKWAGHWAFQPPEAQKVPAPVKNWLSINPIDNFIHASLSPAGLSPQERASKETLIRRVTLDLTGLPPTLEEIDEFLADKSDQAYERVVARLLGSPQYGEHMTRFWLDAARYGDTHGLHLDNERSLWPYRDWVIDSFNSNQPFDQFTVEQLAGDLLPKPTLDQRVATGFNRCNVTTGEGGSIDDEYYMRYAVDRVETTSTVWLGLTAGCAACHDHKFDPLTQREFYQLFSYYFSLTERAMDGNKLLPPPIVKAPTMSQRVERKELNKQSAAITGEIDALLANAGYKDPKPNEPLGDLGEQERVWIDDQLPAGAKPQGNDSPPWKFVEGPNHPVHSGKKSHTRVSASDAITQHFFTEATDRLKSTENSKLFTYVYLDPAKPPKTIQLQFNDGNWEHRATWGEDKAFLAGKHGNANRQMGKLPAAGKWIRLEVPAKDVGLNPGAQLNGWAFTQVNGTVHWDKAGIISRALSHEQKRSQYTWEQFSARDNYSGIPAEVQKALKVERDKRTDEQTTLATRHFLRHVHPDTRGRIAKQLSKQKIISNKLAAIEKAMPSSMVMEDRKQPRQAYVLERGQYTLKREKVSSAVPEWLAPPVKDAPPNRLGLARWLVQPRHPLTARVTVNRFWQQFFGTGLVRTSEDFGVQGEHPSHPELLDGLAMDFVGSGWDVKRFLAQIVTSATYQQSSKITEPKLAADPENRLLARGPRFRLDAEIIRDQALAVSGLLVGKIGGKSVKPYQPPGLWKPVGFGGSNTSVFKQDKGEKLYRRSMYTFWKRTSPPPSMSTFDAPNRETCQVRRARTNTPLQALVLMNDVQFVEAARKFAERVLKEGGASVEDRAAFAFRTIVTRRPGDSELKTLARLFNEYLEQFKASPESAPKLLSVGESPRDQKIDVNELAAWTMVTHLLLNLSETVTKG
ncbi:MAG: PSD1 and planctomycete cytochrome C domain-containing protein [Planctomycetes bacterium]|nr:PSD1 and planctomycete cytochrome C domain-containing protein [Planctomycetota bacterium]